MSALERRSGHAGSHSILPVSAKRYEVSPYAPRWAHNAVSYGLYANRLYPMNLGTDVEADYWQLRKQVMLYDVPEKPLSIRGPDAVELLERTFTRKVANLPLLRGRYALSCAADGTILMDGVLIRLAEDHFWYIIANGEFESWLLALGIGLDVEVSDPGSRVLQIQGPRSLQLLAAASDHQVPEPFNYFHAAFIEFGGQKVLVSRTGWTGEAGIEIYGHRDLDHLALWDHLMAAGEPLGMRMGASDSMAARRIEAGILDNGTDIDRGLTPFGAGLGAFVDFENPKFVGHDALRGADRTQLLFGVLSESGMPGAGRELYDPAGTEPETVVGHATLGDWSPTLEKGIGYVRFNRPAENGPDQKDAGWLGRTISFTGRNGDRHPGEVVALPFYDRSKRIPKGLEAID